MFIASTTACVAFWKPSYHSLRFCRNVIPIVFVRVISHRVGTMSWRLWLQEIHQPKCHYQSRTSARALMAWSPLLICAWLAQYNILHSDNFTTVVAALYQALIVLLANVSPCIFLTITQSLSIRRIAWLFHSSWIKFQLLCHRFSRNI